MKKMCKNCNQVVNEKEKFCHSCGANEFEYITLHSEDEINLKREKIKLEKAERRKQRIKTVKKIFLIFVLINVIFFVIMLILGFCGVFDDDSTTTDGQTSENSITQSINQNPTITCDNNVQNSGPIEISELFSNNLENAEKVLEPQSKAPQDLDAYTRHTYNCVTVICEYGTDNIYSISVDYTNKNTNVEYTVFGLTQNTTRMNWDNALGEMFYQGYDSDGNPVYSYELEYDENTTYDVEITATSDYPDKITVYKYQY